MTTRTATATTHTYELHTFIFPPIKPSRYPVPRYYFPISSGLAHEFLNPAVSPSQDDTPTKPGPECWPFHLLPHPEWVVATILRFTERMLDQSWQVAGMKFVDEEEDDKERVMREKEQRRWEKKKEEDAVRKGRVVYYGGVYYGCWYDDDGSDKGQSTGTGARPGRYPNLGGWPTQRRRGELKCQILLINEA